MVGSGFAFGYLVVRILFETRLAICSLIRSLIGNLSFLSKGRLILAHLCDEPKGLKTGMCMVRSFHSNPYTSYVCITKRNLPNTLIFVLQKYPHFSEFSGYSCVPMIASSFSLCRVSWEIERYCKELRLFWEWKMREISPNFWDIWVSSPFYMLISFNVVWIDSHCWSFHLL